MYQPGVLGRSPAWLPAGQQFAFVRGGNCYLYDLGRHIERLLFSVAPNEIYKLDFSQRDRVYFTQTMRKSQLWLGRMGK